MRIDLTEVRNVLSTVDLILKPSIVGSQAKR